MGKKLDAHMKQLGRYAHKQITSKMKSPFTCPKCSNKTLYVQKIKKNPDGNNVWLGICSTKGCTLNYTMVLKPVFEEIDVYTRICEVERKQ